MKAKKKARRTKKEAWALVLQWDDWICGEVANMRRRLNLKPESKDDLEQAARLGAFRAAQLYNPKKGSYITLCRWWIRASVEHALNVDACSRYSRREGGQRTWIVPEVESIDTGRDGDTVPTELTTRTWEPKVVVEDLLARVSDREQRIIVGHLLEEASHTELGRELHISRERVRQLKNTGLKKIRRLAA